MTEQDIFQLRDLAEAGQVQFKERIVNKDDKYEIGCEMVAFSNSRGVRRALEYDPNAIFSNGVDQREITHSANEFVITIPRKSEQVTNQASAKTDQALGKTDPVSEQPTQNMTNLSKNTDKETDQVAHNTDPASLKSEQPTDQTAQNTTNLSKNTDQETDQPSPKTDQPQIEIDSNSGQPRSKTDQVTHKVKLSKKQLDIKNFCSIPRTAKEILERAGVTNHFYNRTKYIYDLVEAGVLERTIPDKPNDPNQKYRRKQ